ncbi:MAG: hypothetical protein WC867_05065 [Candidatus Pacearchaeota archaeon]|jgi:hypothetical protein
MTENTYTRIDCEGSLRSEPKIIGVFNGANLKPPMRTYFHEFGFKDAFSDSNYPSEMRGVEHLIETYEKNLNKGYGGEMDYNLAILWGNDGNKMIDLFSFIVDTDNWQSNPAVQSFTFKNGVYQPGNDFITCGDGLIMLGFEEQERRSTQNITEYFKRVPKKTGLNYIN